MDVWGWLIVYAVGLGVLQLLVYRYLADDGVTEGRRHFSRSYVDPNRRGDPRLDGLGESAGDDARRADIEDGRHCPHCGAMNEADAVFSRCWRCTRRLSGAR